MTPDLLAGLAMAAAVLLCTAVVAVLTVLLPRDPDGLPWARGAWEQCRAVKEPTGRHSHYGRCELRRHDDDTDHALDRGMDTPRWATTWTGW